MAELLRMMKITGTVRNAETKEPLSWAKITLNLGATQIASLYTNAKGSFAREEAADAWPSGCTKSIPLCTQKIAIHSIFNARGLIIEGKEIWGNQQPV